MSMLLGTRRALLGASRPRFVDEFDVLNTRWVPVVGTLAVNAGALRGLTAGDWLTNTNLYVNPAFEGVYVGGVAPSWGTGGASTPSEQVGRTGSAQGVYSPAGSSDNVFQTTAFAVSTIGWSYRLSGYGRIQAGAGGGTMRVFGGAPLGANTTIGDIPNAAAGWTLLGPTVVGPVLTNGTVVTRLYGANEATFPGTVAVFDDVTWYRANTPALLAGWGRANYTIVVDHISPAAPSVVPWSAIVRYTDALNYWEICVTPNTVGNDLAIVQVTAGVETVRAAADVDWTAAGTDQLEITTAGSTISTRHQKSGAGVWTAGPSYATAVQGETSTQLGVMFYGTGVNRLARFEVKG